MNRWERCVLWLAVNMVSTWPRCKWPPCVDNEDTLAFSVLENIRPMIETLPLEQAADAYARMMQGKARFRMVLLVNGQN